MHQELLHAVENREVEGIGTERLGRAGIVEEHVDATEALDDVPKGRRDRRLCGDVGVDVHAVGAELFGERAAFVVLHVDTRDPGTGPAQHVHRAAADPAASPGHDRDLALQIDHAAFLLTGDACVNASATSYAAPYPGRNVTPGPG